MNATLDQRNTLLSNLDKLKSLVTFESFETPEDRTETALSIRPGLILAYADLESHILIGVARDPDYAEDIDRAIATLTWGCASRNQVPFIESCLRNTVDRIYETGTFIEALSRVSRLDSRIVTLIACRVPVLDEHNASLAKALSIPRSNFSNQQLFGMDQRAKEVAELRTKIWGRRQRFNLADLQSRDAIPAFIPKQYLPLIFDSPHYRALPELETPAAKGAARR